MNAYALNNQCEYAKPQWMTAAGPYLSMVERRIQESVQSDVPVALALSSHLHSAGGKRIRPALTILSALATNPSSDMDRVINFATSVEMVHMASLVHDDVIDEARERRGAQTANAIWGNKLSVLGGDFLLAKAFSILALDSDAQIIRVLSNTAVLMTESEILQASSEGNLADWQANYWNIIRGKTAAFMSTCCECGAIIAEVPDHLRNAVAEYGMQIGFAFQITDDLLDICGDPAITGKELGTDLMNGKFTLPILLALDELNPKTRLQLTKLASDGISRARAEELAREVVESGAAGKARQQAADCAQKALNQLTDLPDSEYKTALAHLAVSLTNRNV